MIENFTDQLSSSEQSRVQPIIKIVDLFPIKKDGWLWAIGTGSVARKDPSARDIDIAIWTRKHQVRDIQIHLEDFFQLQGVEYQSNGVFYGLPILTEKKQKLVSPIGRPIDLFIASIEGLFTPEGIMETYLSRAKHPVIELLLKGA